MRYQMRKLDVQNNAELQFQVKIIPLGGEKFKF